MTLLDAKQYDPTAGRLRRNIIASGVVVVLVLIWLGWMYRNWPEEHVIDQFFAALQKSDFEKAYGIWMHDPNWKQHPDKYSQYPFNDFRSEEHTSELQSQSNLVCRLLLEKKKNILVSDRSR